MKLTKKITALFIAVMMVVSAIPFTAFAATSTVTWTSSTIGDYLWEGESFAKDGIIMDTHGDNAHISAGYMTVEGSDSTGFGFTSTVGNFTQIKIKISDVWYASSADGWSYENSTYTWTGDSDSVTFDSTNIFAALDYIEFTYIESEAPVEPLTPVSYKAAAVDSTTHEVTFSDAICDDYKVVTIGNAGAFEDGNWYVVNSDVTYNGRISVNGDVNLILTDGYTLTATSGIDVLEEGSFTVYGQQNGTGALVANGDSNAAIGNGPVTINGGTVTANGGDYGAGIGACNNSSGCNVTINGGTVNGTGQAGIGSVGWSFNNGLVVINGGTVTATGVNYGIAIGDTRDYCTVNIFGGTVNAIGDDREYYESSGIGGGSINIFGGDVVVNGANLGVRGPLNVTGGDVNITSKKNDTLSGFLTITGGTLTAKTTNGYCVLSEYMSVGEGMTVLSGTSEENAVEIAPSDYDNLPWNSNYKYLNIEPASTATAYADYVNTTTVIKFDDKDWYLIEDNSTSETEGTVTLLSKECVGASIFGGSSTYSGSTVEGVVNNYYTNSISTDAKTVVSGNGMFLLTTDQANAIKAANVDVLKCSQATGAESILWWLGTPCDPYNAACVYGDNGSIRNSGEYVERTLGVRPALTLDLSKVEFDSTTNTFALPTVPHTHDEITFEPWTSTNSLPTEEGSYYLTADVELEDTWYVPYGTINLCLDGHTITCAEDKEILLMNVSSGTIFNLYDKEDNSGTITGGYSSSGGVQVYYEGIFNMYGGTITGNTSTDHGGGVRAFANSTFNMYGGSIENNKTQNQGGFGGGVHIESGTTFNMYGGTIKDNTASSAGGVFIGTNCTFNLCGGSITGNATTGGEGGAVLFTDDGTATFKMSGDVTVSDNAIKIDIDEINVHETYPSNMVIPDSVTIELVDALAGEGKIYVQIGTSRVFTNSTGTAKAKDYIDKFVSDSVNYRIRTEGDELKIEAPYLRIGGTFVYDDNAADVFKDGKVKFTPANETTTYATLTLNGYQYDGTADDDSEGIIYLDSAQLRIVLQGENIVKATNPGIMINREADTIISSENGGSLEVVSTQADAIYANGSLAVDSGTITATGNNRGIAANGVYFNGGRIVATGTGTNGYGIYCSSLPWLPSTEIYINSGITSLIASGTLGAVYRNVANALEGLGWSNNTGTEGQKTIAVTDEARSLEYKKVAFVSHTHSFTYSASGATITATCSADDCTLTDSKATLTIAAPDNLTYDKSAKAAVITDANAIQGTAKVQYQTKNGDAYGEATETAPTNAGTYKASITLGGATASVEYTIAKADPTCTAPTGLTATYGQTLADVTLTNPEGNTAGTWAWLNDTASVGNVVTPAASFKANFIPTDTANYNTVLNVDVTVTVAKKEITVSGITANNKVYDGSCNATIDTSHATISGALSGDTLTVSANASFSDKNAAEDKTVYLTNITLGGESASNYTLASSGQQETATASITAKEVTISGITVNNKVYDGTTAATVNYTSATIQGMVSGDDLSINTDFASSNFADKNVGNNKTVTISSLLLTGSDAANYTVGSVTVTANITAKEVGLAWSNTELTYNGKAQKPTATATGLAGQDTCTVTVVGEETNAGNNYTATAQSLSNSNYKLPENKTTAFKINKANQTAPAAPTEASKTINSITLNTIPNGEYKCGAGDWQTSPTFTGLDQNKSYVFRQRYAADANHNASAGSEESVIRTANHTHSFTYSSSNGTITATCNGAGTCSLTDNKVSFTLTAPTNLVYDGTDKKATLEGVDAFNAATGLNVSANDIIYNDLTNVVTETKNAGTYQALYTLQTDFPRPFAGITFTVAKANPTANDFVFSEPDNLNYDGNNKTATVIPQDGAYGMGDATVKYYSDAARTNEVDYAKNAGTYYVGITVNEGDNYNAASAVLYDSGWKFTVAKVNPTANDFVFSEPDNLNYDGNNKTVTVIPQDGAYGMGDATVKYYSDAARTNEVDYAENAGTYYVGITVNEGDNYNATSAVLYDSSWKFTVAKADITPSVSIEGWTYGEEANQPIVTGNTGKGVVTYLYKEKGASDMSCIEEAPTQAGEYTVKVIIDETDNYNAGSATADFTIAKAKVTITANDKSSKREAALAKLTCTLEGEIFEGDDLGIKVTTNAKAAVAGKYAIKVSYTENANYDVTVVNGTYTVIDRITTSEKTAGKNKINSAVKATVNKDGSVTAKWGAVANAQRFEIYANYCGEKNEFKKIKTVDGNVTSFKITKLGGKKLDQKKSVKIYIIAYRKVNGKYEKITQSVQLHVVGKKNTKYSNAKSIKVNKDEFTLSVKKSATIKPTLVLQNSKKKAVEHVAKFRYQSTNTAVATVDKNGKIKAVGKGTCTIYIFANNGKLKSVKVTVK